MTATPLDIPTGPIDTEPRGFRETGEQQTILLGALRAAGVELGDYDKRIVNWLARWDWGPVAVISSWIGRASGETHVASGLDRIKSLSLDAVDGLDTERYRQILDGQRKPTSLDYALIATEADVTVDWILHGVAAPDAADGPSEPGGPRCCAWPRPAYCGPPRQRPPSRIPLPQHAADRRTPHDWRRKSRTRRESGMTTSDQPGCPPTTPSEELAQRLADAIRAAAYQCDGGCGRTERDCADAHPIQAVALHHGVVADVEAPISALVKAILPVIRVEDMAQQPEQTESPAYTRLQVAAKEATEAAHLHAMQSVKRVFQLYRRYGSEPIPSAEVMNALALDKNEAQQ
ncbi:hypothetical protein [Streptomyces niveus]|uniref:hypothetical protein n=1 Tax=Streptomyces niveus TaxID=193462 RepID=UPI00341A620F